MGVGLDDVCDRSIGEAFGLDMATAADGPEERSLGNASGLHQPSLLRLALGEAGKQPPQFCELREVVDIARRRPAGLAAEAAHALGQVGRKPRPRLLAIAEAGFKAPLSKLRSVAAIYRNYIQLVAGGRSGSWVPAGDVDALVVGGYR